MRGGKDWGFGISRGKLLYIGWMNNKLLLYSTESCSQCPVADCNRRECEKEYVCVCVCVTLSHFAVRRNEHNSVNQLYFNKIKKIKYPGINDQGGQRHMPRTLKQ